MDGCLASIACPAVGFSFVCQIKINRRCFLTECCQEASLFSVACAGRKRAEGKEMVTSIWTRLQSNVTFRENHTWLFPNIFLTNITSPPSVEVTCCAGEDFLQNKTMPSYLELSRARKQDDTWPSLVACVRNAHVAPETKTRDPWKRQQDFTCLKWENKVNICLNNNQNTTHGGRTSFSTFCSNRCPPSLLLVQ